MLVAGCGGGGRDPRCDGQAVDWAFVVLPDTQHYAETYPDLFDAQTAWIASRAAAEKIRFVLHEGDITNDDSAAEWSVARDAFRVLDDAGLPYLLVPGNHDYGVGGSADTRDSLLTATFGAAWPWGTVEEADRFDPATVDDTYAVVRVAGEPWLLLGLEFGPRDGVVAWASQVLDAHPDTPTIVVTHAYLYSDGTRYDHLTRPDQMWSPYVYGIADTGTVNDGQELWDGLIAGHSQVKLVFSGHVLNEGVARRTDVRADGSVVHQVLANYQHRSNGGDAYLRLVQVDRAADVAHVCTYSPFTGDWKTDEGNSFDLPLSGGL